MLVTRKCQVLLLCFDDTNTVSVTWNSYSRAREGGGEKKMVCVRERERERERERQTDRQTDRQTNRERGRRRERETKRHIHT